MRKLLLAFVLANIPFLLLAQAKPDPADYPVQVIIVSSASNQSYVDKDSRPMQILEVLIALRQYELRAAVPRILAPGYYAARFLENFNGPKNPNPNDMYIGYKLLLPDGTTRTYEVTKIGRDPSRL